MRILISLAFTGCLTMLGCATPNLTAQSSNSNPNLTFSPPPSPAAIASPSILDPTKQQSERKSDVQSRFGAEESILYPVTLPEDVLRELKRDERNRTCLNTGQSIDDIPASWFIASEIYLNNDESTDLIVKAANPCLFGANINPFWVFRGTPQGYRIALSVSTLGLEVLNSKTNGYRDIRAIAATSNRVLISIYNYKDGKYQLLHSSQEPIEK